MTRQELYETNISLQTTIHQIIHGCHIQNYDLVVRRFADVTGTLMKVLETVMTDQAFYNQELECVNPQAIQCALQDILTAQEQGDYVLLADLLELQLLPFLQTIQEKIRCYEPVGLNPAVWQRNMEQLKQKDAALWNTLQEYHSRYEKEQAAGTWSGTHHLEDTNQGAFTMAGQDAKGVYYYHSNVNPVAEAVDFARYYYRQDCARYTVWGLGLGYHVRELLRLDDGITLTVVESELDVIYHCFMAVDMSWCLRLPGVSLVYDPDFRQMGTLLDGVTENLILHYPSLRHISNGALREQMEMFFMRDSGKRNTALLFENNSRENFRHYTGSVDELREDLQGRDVIIVAAGPSLDKNVSLLKQKPPGVRIMAVETVFRKLIQLGIEVDYMIVTDANPRIYNHLSGLEQQQIPMLYLSTAYKGYAMNYQGPKYLICQRGYVRSEELAKTQGWQLYDTGGSVSTTALDVCLRLGCSSIAFVGLDLAYTGNLAHAQGTSRREAREAGELSRAPAIGGGTVPVSRVFTMYNRWIAQRVARENGAVPVYDATEGGAVIPGLLQITLQEYLEQKIK